MNKEETSAGWTKDRQRWNDKGWCARVRCANPHEDLEHKDTNLLYCASCAKLINKLNPGLVNKRRAHATTANDPKTGA